MFTTNSSILQVPKNSSNGEEQAFVIAIVIAISIVAIVSTIVHY